MTDAVRDLAGDGRATTRNVSLVFALRAVQYPFLVLYAVLVPRLMGPTVYGDFALLVSFVAIAVSAADLGLSELYGRFVPEFQVRGSDEDVVRLSSSLLALKLLVASVFFTGVFAFLHVAYGGRFPESYLLAVVATALVADVGALPYALVFGLNALVVHALREPVRRVLTLGLVLLLFRLYGLLGALLASVLVEGGLAAFYFARTRRWFRLDRFRPDLSFLRPYLGFGFVVYLSWGMTILWFRSGNAVVDAVTHDPAQVAYFDMASQLFSLTAVFTLLVLSSLIPVFTKLLLTGQGDRIPIWAATGLKAMTVFAAGLAVAFLLGAQDVVVFLLGPSYAQVFPNAAVQLFGLFPMALAQVGMVLAVVQRRPGVYLTGLCVAFAGFLGASLALVPLYGALGASIAMLLSAVVLAGAMLAQLRGRLVACLGPAIRAALLALPFAGLAWLPGTFALRALATVVFLVAYPAALLAARVLVTAELVELWRTLRRSPAPAAASAFG